MFGDNLTYEGTEYLGKMISQKEAKQMQKYISEDPDKVFLGGKVDIDSRFVQPTILANPSLQSEVMK